MCGSYFDKDFLKEQWEKAAGKITGYHIHIYFDDKNDFSAFDATNVAENLRALFPDETDGPDVIGKIGPHTKPNVEVDIIKPESFGKIVMWLQMNNPQNLSILVHPRTGDELKDHLGTALWLGEPVPFNDRFFDMVRKHQDAQNKPPRFGT